MITCCALLSLVPLLALVVALAVAVPAVAVVPAVAWVVSLVVLVVPSVVLSAVGSRLLVHSLALLAVAAPA
jgi:hypothetical protein